jgi:hypothetical protein
VRLYFHEFSTFGGSSFPWRSILKVKVPLKEFFFFFLVVVVWTRALGKIMILNNLRKRRVRGAENLLIIFFFIVKWLQTYGVRSSLESNGLCLNG